MGEQATTFKRIERIIELSAGLIVVSGLIIINLPIIPTPNKTVVCIAAVSVAVFVFVWHKLKISISLMNKNFVESIVYLATIAIIVHVTGGARSYFNFLYLLPNLSVSTTSTRWYTVTAWFITSVFIFGEALLFPQPSISIISGFVSPPLSLAVLNVWAVGLVTTYGRFLAREVETAQIAATEATLEKEKAINKLKDEFLFIISHELRGPITAIRGYLELFLSGEIVKKEGEAKNLASAAFRQSDRLNELIFELLDLSRLEVGKLKLSPENFDINKYLDELLNKEKERAKEKKIEFTFKPTSSALSVRADKERVRETILILIDNAIKYTGEFGKIWVWTQSTDKKAYISVADSGVGISEEDLSHLFDRFYRSVSTHSVGSTEEKKEKSIGLGLFLAKSLIEKMNGEIFVESKLGKGSKFTFTVPLSASS
ncbi:MAG TPA: HAMP domain-containing sensor histidine kinase [Candidatus Nanoarchaeia archaeon]